MNHRVAIVGAGVSGLTCGVIFAEHGHRTAIFAREIGRQTTSAAAAALWFPYDVEPAEKVIPWALETFRNAKRPIFLLLLTPVILGIVALGFAAIGLVVWLVQKIVQR